MVLSDHNQSVRRTYAFVNAQGNVTMVTPISILAAMTRIASLPIIVVYPFLQKYFVQGMTVGGVKG